uniref:C1q and TNF related 1 n=1 Tax=Canis lupus familiaris TaxID=9615 RepID=A0A8P0TSY1_CANLF
YALGALEAPRPRSHLAGVCSLRARPAFFVSSLTFEKPRFRFWPEGPRIGGGQGAGKAATRGRRPRPLLHLLPGGPPPRPPPPAALPQQGCSSPTWLGGGPAGRCSEPRTERPRRTPWRDEENHEKYSPRQGEEASASRCFRCCDPGTPVYQAIPVPQINITILKGEKGDRGDRGLQGKYGKTGSVGARGHVGPKGQKGSMGAPGDRCKNHYAAFSVGRKKPLHSNDYYQTVIFDTEFVNLYGHFNMFMGKFYCYVPGIYFFSLNVHTWNQKETYLHIMKNREEVVILYAQVSDRSIMQSQSLMLELQDQDEVWVRLFKGERENAIFSDEFDTYITFSGYLVKHAAEP